MEILENKLYRMIGGLMKSRKIMIIVASISVLLSIGGCTVKHKDDTKQGKTIATSSTKDLKEDKEAIKKKLLNYLIDLEQVMTTYVKEHNAIIHQVSYDWDSIKTVVGGNGTPQGGDEILLVYGYANESKLTNFSLNFTLDKNKIPKIDSIGSDSLYRIQ